MKKLKRILSILLIFIAILGTKISYAASSNEFFGNVEVIKYICIGIGVCLIVMILFISYKLDNTDEEDYGSEEETNLKNDSKDFEIDDDENMLNSEEPENNVYEPIETNIENEYKEKDDILNESSNTYVNEENIENANKFGLKLEDIIDDDLDNVDYSVQKIGENLNLESNTYNIDDKTNDISGNEGVSLEEDFLMQMNKNFAIKDNYEEDELLDFSDNEVEEKSFDSENNLEEIKEKKTVKKVKEEKPKKQIKKSNRKAETETKKTTRKTTKKVESEEKPKKIVRKTAKKTENEEKPKKTTKKITKKVEKEDKPKKTTRKTTKKD